MERKIKVGDVYEIDTPAGLAYVQYTHDRAEMCQLVRVLPGLHAVRPNIANLVRERELYFISYVLKNAVKKKQARLVSNEPVPEWAQPFPVMRFHNLWDGSWYIGEGANRLKVKELTAEQRKLSISSVLVAHPALVNELMRGWTPEREEEFERIEKAERIARKHAQAKQGLPASEAKPEFVEHYLYFPKKSDADKAGQRLRSKGWIVDVKKGADGENWLALAKQPAPVDDIEETRDELERLAEELGGEYDGWGAAV